MAKGHWLESHGYFLLKPSILLQVLPPFWSVLAHSVRDGLPTHGCGRSGGRLVFWSGERNAPCHDLPKLVQAHQVRMGFHNMVQNLKIHWIFTHHRFHLGTVAFGSCLVALVQLVRAVMAFIENQVSPSQPVFYQNVQTEKIHPAHSGAKLHAVLPDSKSIELGFQKSQKSLAWGIKRFAINGNNT